MALRHIPGRTKIENGSGTMEKRVAIPAIGEMLNEHFGRAQIFKVFQIDNENLLDEKIVNIKGLEHQAKEIATLLKEQGVDAVICGAIGRPAIVGLEGAGLEVVRGANGKVIDVAKAYAEGRIVSSTDVCNIPKQHSYRDIECLCHH